MRAELSAAHPVPGIEIRVEGRAGRITLRRPEALNALDGSMIAAIDRALAAWSGDPGVALVVIDAEGARAFCAGGDIAEVYRHGRRGDFGHARRLWRNEYRMNLRIASYPKPCVALMQGYVLGGGVGLGGHASHRVVGETAQVAMPECAIGLVPDVGATHLLARAPGRLGEFLGLTGHRMSPGDAIRAGFADHLVTEADWSALTAELCASGEAGQVLAAVAPPPEASLVAQQEAIDDAFAAPDLPTLMARLAASDWGQGVRKRLSRQSPLSMACTLALVRAARAEPGVAQALRREFRATWRSVEDGDLLEGIRAQVIDKDRAPQWRDGIGEVGPARVAAMLAPLGRHDFDPAQDQAT